MVIALRQEGGGHARRADAEMGRLVRKLAHNPADVHSRVCHGLLQYGLPGWAAREPESLHTSQGSRRRATSCSTFAVAAAA